MEHKICSTVQVGQDTWRAEQQDRKDRTHGESWRGTRFRKENTKKAADGTNQDRTVGHGYMEGAVNDTAGPIETSYAFYK